MFTGQKLWEQIRVGLGEVGRWGQLGRGGASGGEAPLPVGGVSGDTGAPASGGDCGWGAQGEGE